MMSNGMSPGIVNPDVKREHSLNGRDREMQPQIFRPDERQSDEPFKKPAYLPQPIKSETRQRSYYNPTINHQRKKQTTSNRSGKSIGAPSTNLRCYFGCEDTFKKDYDLHLHLKLRHRNEDMNELK